MSEIYKSFKELFSCYPNFFDLSVDEMIKKMEPLKGQGYYSNISSLRNKFTCLKQIEKYASQPDKKNLYSINIAGARLALWWVLSNLHTENLIADKDYEYLLSELDSISKEPNKIVVLWHSIKDLLAKFINKIIGEHKLMDDLDRKTEERKKQSGILTRLYSPIKKIAKTPQEHHENKHPELNGDSFH